MVDQRQETQSIQQPETSPSFQKIREKMSNFVINGLAYGIYEKRIEPNKIDESDTLQRLERLGGIIPTRQQINERDPIGIVLPLDLSDMPPLLIVLADGTIIKIQYNQEYERPSGYKNHCQRLVNNIFLENAFNKIREDPSLVNGFSLVVYRSDNPQADMIQVEKDLKAAMETALERKRQIEENKQQGLNIFFRESQSIFSQNPPPSDSE